MIKRQDYLEQVRVALDRSPVTAILGPRQCGKTTLSKVIAEEERVTHFDLESPQDQARLQNPELVLSGIEGLIIIDEIQLRPELFNLLRVMVDRYPEKQKYLILGSASPTIIKNVSESLAGRVEFVDLSGFQMLETGLDTLNKQWVRGGFPRSFLAESDENSMVWREGFVRTFLERDIPQLGINIPAAAMRRFWTMLAHYHGQIWNASEFARSMGLNDKTVRGYLDILTGTFMVRQLQPWFENLGKRQVKSPRIYLRDSGLLHTLLTLKDYDSLLAHPKVGASWEGFVIEQILLTLKPEAAYFWATHQGAEVDLMFLRGGKRFGIEVKFNEKPKASRSTRSTIEDLHLEHLWIIYPGKVSYPLDEKITVVPLVDSIGSIKDAQ